MRKPLVIAVLTLGHLALSGAVNVLILAATMGRFDSGAVPTLGERAFGLLSHVLLFPVVEPLARLLPRSITSAGFPWEHMVFFANSLFWATALTALYGQVRRRQVSNEAPQPTMETS